MVEFLFLASCIVFVCTITWLSFKLGETKTLNAKVSAVLGFVLSFIPPLALLYIGILAFRNDATVVE